MSVSGHVGRLRGGKLTHMTSFVPPFTGKVGGLLSATGRCRFTFLSSGHIFCQPYFVGERQCLVLLLHANSCWVRWVEVLVSCFPMHEPLSLVVSSIVPLASRLTEDGAAFSLFCRAHTLDVEFVRLTVAPKEPHQHLLSWGSSFSILNSRCVFSRCWLCFLLY